MTLTVRGSDFKIDFVNNYCREKYQAMLEAADELTEIPDRIKEVDEQDIGAAKARFRALRLEQKDLVQKIGSIRQELLTELLVTNGHEFDAHWWLHKTDVDDINRFVVDCIRKDLRDDTPKKK